MKNLRLRGVSSVEFTFEILVLVPLLLGTGIIGVNMVKNLQTTQVARDVGHMFARGINFGQPGNLTVVGNLGQNLGLNTAGGGNAVVILSAVTYVDDNACAGAGEADTHGVHTGACTNYGNWVFQQRVTVGNPSVRSSNYGAPLTSGPTGVPMNSDGTITLTNYCTYAGARATFSGVNPYSIVNGQAQGLPSGQVLYIAEAAAYGYNMQPFVNNAVSYSWGIF